MGEQSHKCVRPSFFASAESGGAVILRGCLFSDIHSIRRVFRQTEHWNISYISWGILSVVIRMSVTSLPRNFITVIRPVFSTVYFTDGMRLYPSCCLTRLSYILSAAPLDHGKAAAFKSRKLLRLKLHGFFRGVIGHKYAQYAVRLRVNGQCRRVGVSVRLE